MNKEKGKRGLNKGDRKASVDFLPYLLTADESLHARKTKPQLERLDRKHLHEGNTSNEGFIEIQVGEYESLELVDGGLHERMLHHGTARGRTVKIEKEKSSEKRRGTRYENHDIEAKVKLAGLFGGGDFERATLLDFSVNGAALVFRKKLRVGKKIQVKIKFPDGSDYTMECEVVRAMKGTTQAEEVGCGIYLKATEQSYRDHVLREGLNSKLIK